MPDAATRMLENRLNALEDKLARSNRALATTMGLVAGVVRVLSMEYPAARSQLETALLDAIDTAQDVDPVGAQALAAMLERLRKDA